MSACSLAEIGIVAHVSRAVRARALAASVGAAAPRLDDGTLGCEGNHLRVWSELATATTPFAVVLEDDALPVPDFTAQLAGVLAAAPTPIVSLYLGRARPPAWQPWIMQQTINANRQDCCYIVAKRVLHGVGVAIRTELIADMLTRIELYEHGVPIDEAMSAWAMHRRHAISYCWPSIVDHDDGPTLVDHRDGKARTVPRTAWSYGSRSAWRATVLGG